MGNNGGSALTMHNTWKVNCKLQVQDNGVVEHESICKMLEIALEYDQLNLGELAVIELMCRRLQMLQYRWRDHILGAVDTTGVNDEIHYHGDGSHPRKLVHCTFFEYLAR